MWHVKKKPVLYALHALTALFLGLVYYLIRRPDILVSRLVFRLTGLQIPQAWSLYTHPLLRITDSHLADFLWAYALTFSIGAVYYGRRNWHVGLITCLVSDCFMEMTQGFHLLSGTFDWMDILVQVGATLLVQWMMLKMERGNKNVGEQQKQ